MLSSPRRMKLHGSLRMGWIQRRQCVLPPPCPAALTFCCQLCWRTGKVATAGLFARNLGGQRAQLQSHRAKLYLFPFGGHVWQKTTVHLQDWSVNPLTTLQSPQAGSPLISPRHFFFKVTVVISEKSICSTNSHMVWIGSELILQMVMVCLYPEW